MNIKAITDKQSKEGGMKMRFEYLKEHYYHVNHCMMLNRWVDIGDQMILIVAITSTDDGDRLVYLYRYNEILETLDESAWFERKSNRDMLEDHMSKTTDYPKNTIERLTLLGQSLDVLSVKEEALNISNPKSFMSLQFFFERGLDVQQWLNVDIATEAIYYVECELAQRFNPIVSHIKPDDLIEVTFSENVYVTRLDEPLVCLVNPQGIEPFSVVYKDPLTSKDHTVFINAMKHYNFRHEENSPFKGEWVKTLPREVVDKLKRDYEETSDKICPKDHVMALMEYETDDDARMLVYRKAYLDEESQDISSASAFFFMADSPLGPHQYKNHVANLGPIHPDMTEDMEIEFIGKYNKRPRFTILSPEEGWFYKYMADYYHDIFPAQAKVDFIDRHVQPQSRILDVGSSDGRVALGLAKKGHAVVAIDLSEDMVRVSNHVSDNGRWFQTINMNMQDVSLHFEKEAFDTVSCLGNTLVHLSSLEDIKQAILGFADVLKPKGKFILQIVHYDYIYQNHIDRLPLIENDRVTFERYYCLHPDDVTFETSLYIKSEDRLFKNKTRLKALRLEELKGILEAAGLHVCHFYGTFMNGEFTEDSSTLIVIAEK